MRRCWERKHGTNGYYFERTCISDGGCELLNNGENFKYATEFEYGISVIYNNTESYTWEIIDTHGRFVDSKKAKICCIFGNILQYAIVWVNCLGYNIVAKGEGFIFDEFVDNIETAHLVNVFKIKRIRKIFIRSIENCNSFECSFEYNLFTADGKMVLGKWAKNIEVIKQNFIKITEFDNTFSIYDESLHLLYDNLICFSPLPNDCYKIGKEIDSDYIKYNVIDEYGELLSDEWFDEIIKPSDDAMIVIKDKKLNLMSYFGDIISQEWFDRIEVATSEFIEGHPWCGLFGKYHVWKDDKQNLLTYKGELISSLWADIIYYNTKSCVFYNKGREDLTFNFNIYEK